LQKTLRKSNRLAWLGVPAACAVSMAALLLSFAPFGVWPLAYVALVPWALAMALAPRRWYALVWAYASGLMFWFAGLYWIWWVDVIGFVALVAALSGYMLASGALIRAAIRRRLPAVAVLPVVWISIEFIRLYALSGFPWFVLSHSQYRNTMLIQVVDWMGELGPGLLVAMVNGVGVDAVLAWRSCRGRHVAGILPARPEGVSPSRGGETGVTSSSDQAGGTHNAGGTPARHAGKMPATRPILGGVACVAVAAGMLAYGWFRLSESESTLHDGPVVAVVQHAYPIYLNAVPSAESSPAGMYRQHMESTRALEGMGVDLVVWPESMGPTLLGREFMTMDLDALTPHERRAATAAIAGPAAWKTEYSDSVIDSHLRDVRDGDEGVWHDARELADMSRSLDATLLVGTLTLHRNGSPLDDRDLYVRRNSVALIDREPLPVGEYSKKHLVPFGEYVPFKHGWPGFHKFLRSFVPPEMPQLDPGTDETILLLPRSTPRAEGVSPSRPADILPARGGEGESSGEDGVASSSDLASGTHNAGETPAPHRIAAPICYEGVIARLCRSLVMDGGDKRADMIVNLSNDGWFVHRDAAGRWQGTTEQPQHLSQYVFRAIENRVPVVRAVNTGISAYVDSNGRIRAEIVRDGQHVMVSGTLVLDGTPDSGGHSSGIVHGPRVRLDDRVSPYGRWGNGFPWVMLAICGALTVYLSIMRRIEKRAPGCRMPDPAEKTKGVP